MDRVRTREGFLALKERSVAYISRVEEVEGFDFLINSDESIVLRSITTEINHMKPVKRERKREREREREREGERIILIT